MSKSNVEVTLNLAHPMSQKFVKTIVDRTLFLTIFEKTGASVKTIWKGRLTTPKPKNNEVAFTFESVFTSMRRPGLRARFQKTCRHPHYEKGCNLDKELFKIPGTIVGVVDNVVQVTEAGLYPDGWFLGGMVRTGFQSYGYVIDHTGEFLTLQIPMSDIGDSLANSGYGENYGNYMGGPGLVMFPGCDRLRQTCLTKFDNLNNNGSFPWLPSRNPMDGSSII